MSSPKFYVLLTLSIPLVFFIWPTALRYCLDWLARLTAHIRLSILLLFPTRLLRVLPFMGLAMTFGRYWLCLLFLIILFYNLSPSGGRFLIFFQLQDRIDSIQTILERPLVYSLVYWLHFNSRPWVLVLLCLVWFSRLAFSVICTYPGLFLDRFLWLGVFSLWLLAFLMLLVFLANGAALIFSPYTLSLPNFPSSWGFLTTHIWPLYGHYSLAPVYRFRPGDPGFAVLAKNRPLGWFSFRFLVLFSWRLGLPPPDRNQQFLEPDFSFEGFRFYRETGRIFRAAHRPKGVWVELKELGFDFPRLFLVGRK